MLKNLRILIVDDEPDLAELLEIEFQSLGAVTKTAGDGNIAFDLLQQERFDAVLSDIRMPGCSGIELVRKVRSAAIDTAFIFMSGYAESSAISQEAREMSTVLLKPFERSALVDAIKNAVTVKHQPLEVYHSAESKGSRQ